MKIMDVYVTKKELKMFRITYYDPREGVRKNYMEIGFETYENAFNQLACIRRNKKEFLKDNRLSSVPAEYLKIYMIGQRWKIEPIKMKSIKHTT